VALKKAMQGRAQQGDGEGAQEQKLDVPDPPASPHPVIETISPMLVNEGSPTTTLTIKGFGFVRRLQVFFNGRSVPYKAIGPVELQVILDASLLRTPGKFDLVVSISSIESWLVAKVTDLVNLRRERTATCTVTADRVNNRVY